MRTTTNPWLLNDLRGGRGFWILPKSAPCSRGGDGSSAMVTHRLDLQRSRCDHKAAKRPPYRSSTCNAPGVIRILRVTAFAVADHCPDGSLSSEVTRSSSNPSSSACNLISWKDSASKPSSKSKSVRCRATKPAPTREPSVVTWLEGSAKDSVGFASGLASNTCHVQFFSPCPLDKAGEYNPLQTRLRPRLLLRTEFVRRS